MNLTNDWRDQADSVKYRLKYILTKQNAHQDVVIIVGSGSFETVVKAHSLILIMGSQVFEKLLETAIVNNEGVKEIKMPDVTPEAMRFVLKYIYTDFVNLETENALDILYVSVKLNLRHLTMLCIAKLGSEMSALNVLYIWEEAIKMNVEELVQTTQSFILKNARDVFEQKEFLNVTKENLWKLLASDDLALDEVSLFKCLLSWGEAECERFELKKNTKNLRCVLEKLLPLIRFTLMTSNQFATFVVKTNILEDKEVIDVYNYLSAMNSSDANEESEPPQWIASTSPRNLTVGEQSVVSKNNENEYNSESIEEYENTKKERLLQYFQEIKQTKTIGGVFCLNQADTGIKIIENVTGVRPGVLSRAMPSCWNEDAKWQSFTEEIILNWNNGFLIRVEVCGDHHPLLKAILRDQKFKWTDLINDNGGLNKEWKNQLDAIAPYFKQLQNAGVVVICDLLPYINNELFPWGGLSGNFGALKLYQITRDYLTKNHGLNSILWTWSVSIYGDMKNLKEFWPGNDYVDIASVHIFDKKKLEMDLYHKLLEVVGNKPISMESIHTVPTPELLAEQPGWTWFTVRDDLLKDGTYNTFHGIRTIFNSLSVINKGNNEFFKSPQSRMNEQNTQGTTIRRTTEGELVGTTSRTKHRGKVSERSPSKKRQKLQSDGK